MLRGEAVALLLFLLFKPSLCLSGKGTSTDRSEEILDSSTTEIPRVLKAGVTNVFFLGSQIDIIPKRAFFENPQLLNVEFIDSNITFIEPGALEGLADLEAMELSSNPLTAVPVGVSRDLNNLKKIILKIILKLSCRNSIYLELFTELTVSLMF